MTKKALSVEEQQELIEKADLLEKENKQLRNEPDDYGIRLDAYIEVMSLVDHKLNLSTRENGQGTRFSFTKFGEVKRILYNDLASIFENYRSFMEAGLFYIMNPRVVRKHGLDDIYEKLLTKDMILKVVNCGPNALKLYENATSGQQETIEGMIVAELKSGNTGLDLNVIAKIGKIAGKDLIALAEEAKQLEATPIT